MSYPILVACRNNGIDINHLPKPRFKRKLAAFNLLLLHQKKLKSNYLEIIVNKKSYKIYNKETLKLGKYKIRIKIMTKLGTINNLKTRGAFEDAEYKKFQLKLFLRGHSLLLRYLRSSNYHIQRRKNRKCVCSTCHICLRMQRAIANNNAWIEKLTNADFYTQQQLRDLEDSEKEILINVR